jgi:TRAP-type C4-dicarboxylate transport system permease small subunit
MTLKRRAPGERVRLSVSAFASDYPKGDHLGHSREGRMRTFQTVVFGLSRLSAGLACLLVVAMVLHILYEIVLRTFFSSSTFVLDEFVGYAVAATTFLALGYSFEHGSLIRVGLLLERLDAGSRRVAEIVCGIATLIVMGGLTWYFWLILWRSWVRGRVSSSIAEVPMWIPESLVFAGALIFCLQLVAYLIRQLTNEAPPVVVEKYDIQHDL